MKCLHTFYLTTYFQKIKYMKTVIVWFRNDVRLHDHEALWQAAKQAQKVLLVYCLNPQMLETGEYGYTKLGIHRAGFVLESLQDLRQSLQQKGQELIFRLESPATAIPELAKICGAEAVFAHHEYTQEEVTDTNDIRQALPEGCNLQLFHGLTMVHPDDLPFLPRQMPDVFTDFRKKTEKQWHIRDAFLIPDLTDTKPDLSAIESGQILTLEELGFDPIEHHDKRAAIHFTGGERAGQERLRHYFNAKDKHLSVYKETRNGLLGADYSSKFSAWLATGNLSPRFIYHEVKTYEEQHGSNQSTYWLIFELLWRDYFKFLAMKHGPAAFFLPGGLKGETNPQNPSKRKQQQALQNWTDGNTGEDFVDANMTELYQTGYMSNRGRQNAGSYLVHNQQIDWRKGAAWFEEQLIDYDACSNWGNWMYVAGVGTDPRSRKFNIARQADMYDKQGKYQSHWLD